MTIDSVGVSNTSGYSFTGGDPTVTNIVGAGDITPYSPMTGGGKRRTRRKQTKKSKLLSKLKINSIKKYAKKKQTQHKVKKTMKRRKLRKSIIKSIEQGKQVSASDKNKLTPSMQSFLDGIESGSKSASIIKFKDFKSEPGKKKKKTKVKSKGVTRGGRCGPKRHKRKKKTLFSMFF